MKRFLYSNLLVVSVLWIGFGGYPTPRHVAQSSPKQGPMATAHFAFGGNVSQIPAEFVGHLVFLPVRVNQSEPSLFELNSAAPVSSISPDRAAELGLSKPLVPDLNLAGVNISLASLAEIADKNFASRMGRPYEGTLGNDFLHSAVAELDYARETLRLYDPAVYRYSERGAELHVNFVSGVPVVPAKFRVSGRKTYNADFVVNTALGTSVLFFNHYTEAHRLLRRHFKTIPAYPEPGETPDDILGRIRSFQIGPYEVDGPLAVFSKRNAPDASDPRLAGEIGGGILQRFTIVFNYAHQQILFAANDKIRDEDVEDMSGIYLAAGGPGLKRFEVVRVQPGTPGATAGVQTGDIIEGIDDEPAADLSLLAIRELFRQEDHAYRLLVERDGKMLTLKMRLHSIL